MYEGPFPFDEKTKSVSVAGLAMLAAIYMSFGVGAFVVVRSVYSPAIGFVQEKLAAAVPATDTAPVAQPVVTVAEQPLYVAAGQDGMVAVSRDLGSWVLVSTGFGADIRDLAQGNGRFVAVGEGGRVAVSTDGMAWSATGRPPVFSGETITHVDYRDGRFEAMTNSKRVGYSADGLTWVAGDSKVLPKSIKSVAIGSDRALAIGKDGRMMLARAGSQRWTVIGSADKLSDVVYDGSKFVMVGGRNGGQIITSADGVSTTIETTPAPIALHTIAVRA